MNAWNAIPADVVDFGSVKKFDVFSSKLILVVLPNVLNFLFCFNMFLLCLYDLLGFILFSMLSVGGISCSFGALSD